jgi:hypothetical protein
VCHLAEQSLRAAFVQMTSILAAHIRGIIFTTSSHKSVLLPVRGHITAKLAVRSRLEPRVSAVVKRWHPNGPRGKILIFILLHDSNGLYVRWAQTSVGNSDPHQVRTGSFCYDSDH